MGDSLFNTADTDLLNTHEQARLRVLSFLLHHRQTDGGSDCPNILVRAEW